MGTGAEPAPAASGAASEPAPAASGAASGSVEPVNSEGESYVSIDPGIGSGAGEGATEGGESQSFPKEITGDFGERVHLLTSCPITRDNCSTFSEAHGGEAELRRRPWVLAGSVVAFFAVVVCGTVYAVRGQSTAASQEELAGHASGGADWPEPVASKLPQMQGNAKSSLAAAAANDQQQAARVKAAAAEQEMAKRAPHQAVVIDDTAAGPHSSTVTVAPPTFAPNPGEFTSGLAYHGNDGAVGWQFVARGSPSTANVARAKRGSPSTANVAKEGAEVEVEPSHRGSTSATLVESADTLENMTTSAAEGNHSRDAGDENQSTTASAAHVMTKEQIAEAEKEKQARYEEEMMLEIANKKKHVGCKAALRKEREATGLPGTVEKWGQCGGEGYEGDTRCKKNLYCKNKPLPKYASYMQCVPDNRDRCEDMKDNKDSACWHKVTWDMEVGIVQKPDMYNGLTVQATWEDFQQQNHNFLEKKSGCPAPCASADSSCYEVLNIEGCDSQNEFSCDKADNTLAFDCCCRKYHPKNTTTWAAAEKAQAAPAMKKPSMFCVALIMPNSYEVELMRAQFDLGIGIFDPACDAWAVFSNDTISMSCGSNDTKFDTTIMGGSLEAPRGGEYNTAMNTGVFERFWDAVIWDGRAQSYDWLVKVDADTLFFPGRLKQILSTNLADGSEPPGGLFLNDCHLGMHGPIEVFGKEALKSYAQGRNECVNGQAGEHGQEDVYLRECFKQLGVMMVDAFNILLEGMNACEEKPSAAAARPLPPCFAPEAAFHPFKNIRSMMHCWAEAITVDTSELDMSPISDPPSIWNGRHTYIHT